MIQTLYLNYGGGLKMKLPPRIDNYLMSNDNGIFIDIFPSTYDITSGKRFDLKDLIWKRNIN